MAAKKLLLVEDDAAIQRMYSKYFRFAGFEVITANDGTLVQETVELERPDIIIMDVMMPNFNGLDALRELKMRPNTRYIPVIMLSGNDDSALIQQALKLGAARYLIKSNTEPKNVAALAQELITHY